MITRLTVIVGVFLGLHLMSAFWNPFPLWGVDTLRFLPDGALAAFFALTAFLLIPRTRLYLVRLSAKLPVADGFLERRGSMLLLLVVASVAFVGARSATHLLGDGYLLVRELDTSIHTGSNKPLFLWLIGKLHALSHSLSGSAEFTYRACSIFSGIFYVFLSRLMARKLGRSHTESVVILGFLLTAGFLLLFFGYVETYPILFPATLLYLLIGIETLRGKISLWVPSLLLGLLIPLHLKTISLSPSLLLLAVFLHLNRSSVRPARPQGRIDEVPSQTRPVSFPALLKTLATLATAPAVALILLLSLGFNPSAYAATVGGRSFLPLLSAPGFSLPYRLFDPAHMLDVLNQFLLTGSSFLMVLFLRPGTKLPERPEQTFLLWAGAFPFLLTFLGNPEIGAFRDWDVMAFPSLPLTLWAALSLTDRVRDNTRLAHAGILICGGAALHTSLWIGLNAGQACTEDRFIQNLEVAPLSPSARAFGWETIGVYYRDSGRETESLNAYRMAVDANPENPRYWMAIGNLKVQDEQFESAARNFQQAIKINPRYFEAHTNLGGVYVELGRPENALDLLRRALEINPDYAIAFNNLGAALRGMGEKQLAINAFRRAIELDAHYSEVYYNLGSIYMEQGQIDSTRHYFLTLLELDPSHWGRHEIRAWLSSNP